MQRRREFVKKAAVGTAAVGLLAAGRGSAAIADTSSLPVVVKGGDGYSGNLQEWRSGGGSAVVAVGSGGSILQQLPGAAAPFAWETALHTFNGVPNPTSFFGYNKRAVGGPIVPGESSAAYVIEGDYDDGSSRTVEMYLEAFDATHAVGLRPLFFRFRRSAADPAALLMNAQIAGPLNVVHADGDEIATFNKRAVRVHAPDPGPNTLYVHRAPGHPASLALGDEPEGGFVLRAGRNTRTASIALAGRTVMRLYAAPRAASDATLVVEGTLATAGRLLAGAGLAVGNASPAGSLGCLQRQIEVFDEAGRSVGVVPVYEGDST